jgi:hypothetical protein
MIRQTVFALALALPSAAMAQIDNIPEQRLEVLGEALPACVIRTPSATSGNNATFTPVSGTTGEIQIVEFVNPSNAQPRAASINVALPVICNSPHQLVLRSTNGGLRREGSGGGNQGPFAEFKPYTIAADWAGNSLNVASDAGGAVTISSPFARAGDVSVSIDVEGGGAPLVAGTYSDEIVVEFTAAY